MSKFNYTDEEICLYIKNNYMKYTQNEIGLYLGISRSKVNRYVRTMGIRKIRHTFNPKPNEIVEPIQELNNMYGISNMGNFINLKTNTLVKPKLNKDGYKIIITQQNYKKQYFLLHRMIALYFVEGYSDECNVVNHIDGNKLNNNIENLEWCSVSYNNKHFWNLGLGKVGSECTNSKINEDIALSIYNDYHINKLSQKECRLKYNTTRSIVQKIIYKQRWKHIHL